MRLNSEVTDKKREIRVLETQVDFLKPKQSRLLSSPNNEGKEDFYGSRSNFTGSKHSTATGFLTSHRKNY